MIVKKDVTRRELYQDNRERALLAGVHCALPLPAWAVAANSGIKRTTPQRRHDLTIGYSPIRIDGREGTATATAINGTVPGPLVHLREGDDVLVRPEEDRAFTLFAESLDRSGYTRGTLAPEPGMSAPLPAASRTMLGLIKKELASKVSDLPPALHQAAIRGFG